jgi:hypothetical protein
MDVSEECATSIFKVEKFQPEDGGSTFHWNVRKLLQYMVSPGGRNHHENLKLHLLKKYHLYMFTYMLHKHTKTWIYIAFGYCSLQFTIWITDLLAYKTHFILNRSFNLQCIQDNL